MQNNIIYNNFNLLRLFAALQVVYIHSVEHLNITNSIALYIKDIIAPFPGVSIFFLISGYLITMSYEKNQNIYEYSKNRILRIFPGLYVSFFIGLIILWYFEQFLGVNIMDIVLWSIAQLTLFQFYNPEFIRDFGVGVINGSLWTISVELTFYIFLPLIYIFLQKNFYKRFFWLVFISLSFYFYIQHISKNILIYEKLIGCSILPYLFYFLFGLYLYKYRAKVEKYFEDKLIIYLPLYIVLNYFPKDQFLYELLKISVFSMFVFSFAFSYRRLSYRLIKYNDFTYGIYIYHMFVVNIFVQIGYIGSVETLIWVLVLSILCGILSYFLVEKPFLSLKKKSLFNELNKKKD